MDAESYVHKMPEKSLDVAERENKRNYIDSCLHQRNLFPLLVISVYGLIGTDEEATMNHLTSRLAIKCQKSYYRKCRYVWSRVTITMV